MLKSAIVKKTLLVSFSLILVQILIVYFYIFPLNRDNNYKLMERHGKEVLNRIYEVADDYYREIISRKKEMISSKKQEIKNTINLSIVVIEELYKSYLKGQLSKKEAQELAIEFIENFRYENNNYLWLMSKNNSFLSHPMKQDIEKGDFSLDKEELEILKNIVYRARKVKDDCYYSYQWKRARGEEKHEKTSYFKLFSKWDWIIGTGFYIDDIDKKIENRKNELSKKIEDIVVKTHIGKTGYLYIFNDQHRMLYHPNRYILGDGFKDLKNPENKQTMAESLEDAFYTPSRTLYYRWDHPSDQKSYKYIKVAWINYHDGLKWYIGSSAYLDELNKGSGQIRTILLINSAFIGLLLLIFMIYLFRSILLPISKLSELSKKVGKGDYSKIEIESNDEVGQLAKSFDSMIFSIRENIEKEQLLADEKLKVVTEMLGLIAHHWRQPLTVISTSVFDIVESYEYDELSSEYLDKRYEYINNILQEMSEMIDQFRLIFKPEEEKSIFSICEILKKVIKFKSNVNKDIDFSINQTNIKLFKCTSSTTLNGYTREFEKLISVFINNSVDVLSKKEEKFIKIDISEDQEYIKIGIEDSGGGIPEELKEKIFQPYFTTKHQSFGTGLGLYMAKMVIEMNMKGKLSLSNGEKGAIFFMELRKV